MLPHYIKSAYLRFCSNNDGNIAAMAAVAGLTLVAGVGFAVDTSGGRHAKQELQRNLDMVSVVVANSGVTDLAEQYDIAQDILKANNYIIKPADLLIRTDLNGDVDVTGAVKHATSFASIWGQDFLSISANSVATAGTSSSTSEPTDIVLVLDTTDSMDGAKLTALQSSANKLIDTLSGGNNNQIQMGMVPFSAYINVGTEHRHAFWIDVEPDETITKTETEQIRVADGFCRGNPNANLTRISDGVVENYIGCGDYVEPVYEDGPEITTTEERTWEGCVLSRSKGDGLNGLNLTDENWVNEQVSSHNRGDWQCSNPVVPLTSQLTTVSTNINALDAGWDTYMPAGIAWGWRVLSPREPFTGGRADAKQIMVLMTDGLNSMAKFGRAHGRVNLDTPDAEAKLDRTNQDTASLCQNVKDANIEIYTIAFEVNDADTKSLLGACSSNVASHFFDASDSTQLEDAFLEIGGNITVEASSARLTR